MMSRGHGVQEGAFGTRRKIGRDQNVAECERKVRSSGSHNTPPASGQTGLGALNYPHQCYTPPASTAVMHDTSRKVYCR